MPQMRRHWWIALAFAVALGLGTFVVPVMVKMRTAEGLAARTAEGAPFAMREITDFDWIRLCIMGTDTPDAVVAEMTGRPYRLSAVEGGRYALLFLDAAGTITDVRIERPELDGPAGCWSVEAATVLPLGDGRFAVEPPP